MFLYAGPCTRVAEADGVVLQRDIWSGDTERGEQKDEK